MIKDLEVEENVAFQGKVARDKLLQLYKEYDFLLFPSNFNEPLGVVLLEAMSQKLPIIATKAGAIPEVITHEVNGLLVTPEDSIMMAEAVKRLVETPSLAQKISSNGIRRIREEFNTDKIMDRLEDYLKRRLTIDT